jgi:hypothetical protein
MQQHLLRNLHQTTQFVDKLPHCSLHFPHDAWARGKGIIGKEDKHSKGKWNKFQYSNNSRQIGRIATDLTVNKTNH